jgi:hypothetical protein
MFKYQQLPCSWNSGEQTNRPVTLCRKAVWLHETHQIAITTAASYNRPAVAFLWLLPNTTRQTDRQQCYNNLPQMTSCIIQHIWVTADLGGNQALFLRDRMQSTALYRCVQGAPVKLLNRYWTAYSPPQMCHKAQHHPLPIAYSRN